MDEHDTSPPPLAPAAAWSAYWSDQGRWLRRVALARLGNGEEVDEVLQNVAMAALVAQQRATPVTCWGPWLYRVVIRQCLLLRRRRGRERRLHDYQGDMDRSPTSFDPLEWLLADERQSLVRDALQRLPRGDVELLLLKYVERWSYQRMASELGVKPSTIETRLHRARERLRRDLKVRMSDRQEFDEDTPAK